MTPTYLEQAKKSAKTAFGVVDVCREKVDEDARPSPRESRFPQILSFPLLNEWLCEVMHIVRIQQQLVESLFSSYDTRTHDHDWREFDM